jgi:RNA polymerase sigma-70 factor (ECF subfamily)
MWVRETLYGPMALMLDEPAKERVAISAEELYLRHKDEVYRVCLRLGAGNVAWAEDATHDVFIKLMERLPQLTDHQQLGGWVYRVAANTCLSRLKRDGSVWSKVRCAVLGRGQRATPTPERELELRQELAEVVKTLKEMEPKERVVFCMRYLDQRPQQEIARTLDLSKGYVSKLLKRARVRIVQAGFADPGDVVERSDQ